MKVFALKRLLQTLIIMVVILTLLFVLFRLMPGDPTTFMLQSDVSVEEQKYLLAKWGLDQPLWKQYILYFKNFFAGDFGSSFYYNKPVVKVLGEKILNSLILMGVSISLAVVIGGAIGIHSGAGAGLAAGHVDAPDGLLHPLHALRREHAFQTVEASGPLPA